MRSFIFIKRRAAERWHLTGASREDGQTAGPEEGASLSVCGMTDSRNWDGNGDRQSLRVRDGGLRVMLARIEIGAPEFFRPPIDS